MNTGIKAENSCAFSVSVADALDIVWDLARIMAGVICERPPGASLVIDLWLPLHIRRRIELTALELRRAVSAEAAHRSIHDIA